MINPAKPAIWTTIRNIVRDLTPPRIRWLRRAIINRKPKFIRKHGDIVFMAWHPILDQLSREIIVGLDNEVILGGPVTIYVGIHRDFGLAWFRRGLKIGIQTEQLYDADGMALFGLKKTSGDDSILWGNQLADYVIDLSENNRKFYEEDVPKDKRPAAEVMYGPHIFPSNKIPFNREGLGLLFFGAISEDGRRAEIIRRIDGPPVTVVPGGTYGEELYALIDQCQGVLNIHYADGVYTEAPRLLTAYLRGKVVYSELLDSIFEPGVDYMVLGHEEEGDVSEVFERFSEKVTSRYSFSNLLRAIADLERSKERGKGTGPAR